MIASTPNLPPHNPARQATEDDRTTVTARLRAALSMTAMLATPFLFWSAVAFLIWLMA